LLFSIKQMWWVVNYHGAQDVVAGFLLLLFHA
jgi:hypothetical protein